MFRDGFFVQKAGKAKHFAKWYLHGAADSVRQYFPNLHILYKKIKKTISSRCIFHKNLL